MLIVLLKELCNYKRLFLFILTFFITFEAKAFDKIAQSAKKNFPIIIKSDILELDDELKLIKFTGNVVATKGELKIKCKKMVVYYTSSGKSSSTESKTRISKIVATGNVRIYRGKQGGIATANKAVYYQEDEKVVLTGRPMVKQGRDFVEGERIIIYLKENRSVVESSKDKQVKAIIFPRPKKK